MTDLGVDLLWKKLIDDWDNDAAHRALLEHCNEADLLVEAALRYRGVMHDERYQPKADEQLERSTALAMATIEVRRTTPEVAQKEAAKILVSFVFLAMAAAIFVSIGR